MKFKDITDLPQLPELQYRTFKHPAGGTFQQPQFLPEHLKCVIIFSENFFKLNPGASQYEVGSSFTISTVYHAKSAMSIQPNQKWVYADEFISKLQDKNELSAEALEYYDKYIQAKNKLDSIKSIITL